MSASDTTSSGPTRVNRLAQESSAYLRQHAHNPVDWYPWGDEALQKAKAENKPILLSIGYSACHWCHVMAHESFEDPAVAEKMNALFVNVKVDREERPDLDQLYQGVVQLMGRGGGWPLTVFLTPELRPFFGGTYFPPVERYGMPSFSRLLDALHDAFANKPDDVKQQAEQFEAGLRHLAAYGLDGSPTDLSVRDITGSGQNLERRIDKTHGGFGSAPKFPNPMNLALMLRAYRRSGAASLLSSVRLSMEKMCEGGIYDHLGGGFHRYSVDERWLVPHFEKMLYDNAQLLHLLAELEQLDPRPLWRAVAEQTVGYLRREMLSPHGTFFATQDADSEGVEGKFFVWTPKQVAEVVPPELAELACAHFGITDEGNFEHGQTVLSVVKSATALANERGVAVEEIESKLASAKQQLFEARAKRVHPGRDEKVLAGWNGLMIRGLAFASRVFGKPEWTELARTCASHILDTMWKDGTLLRVSQDGQGRIPGFLEDYGGMASGLTALYQATFERRFLDAAEAIASAAQAQFWDSQRMAYLAAPRDQKDLFCATYALHDNASPSGASLLAEALVTLGALLDAPERSEQAMAYLRKVREEMVRSPMGFGHLLLAADDALEGAAEVTLVGERSEVEPFLQELARTYAPTVAVRIQTPESPAPGKAVGRDRVQGKAAAYLCRNFACEAPVTSAEELRTRLMRMSAVPVVSF